MRSINITSLNNTELLCVPTVLDYFELMKPRVMSLVVFTNLAPINIHPVLCIFSILAIALGAVSYTHLTLPTS